METAHFTCFAEQASGNNWFGSFPSARTPGQISTLMVPDNIACPRFRKLCPACGRYYPEGMGACLHDRSMLVTVNWDYDSDELESWLARSRFFGSKHCLRCNKHFRRVHESFCPDDGSVLERCTQEESGGPILDRHYQLKSYIGNGRLSRVYYALELETGAPRVVKFLRADLSTDEKTVTRYLKIAEAAVGLQHNNIIRTYCANLTDSGAPYVVTQYLTGQSLRDELIKRNRLDSLTTLNIFIDLVRGLQYAHANNVVHTNLTPSNVYVIQRGERASAMIVDFGAAERLFTSVDWESDNSDTHTSNVYGDPLGMCPEFASGQRPSVQSDIYQVGCCLYECLNGRPPFLRNRAIAILMAHAKDRPDDFDPSIPEPLKTVTLECLKKNPEDRFQSSTELRFVLEECRRELSKTPYIEKRSIS